MDSEDAYQDPRRVAEQRKDREIGATAGKTHEEVLDEVVGRERRLKNERRAGGAAGDES